MLAKILIIITMSTLSCGQAETQKSDNRIEYAKKLLYRTFGEISDATISENILINFEENDLSEVLTNYQLYDEYYASTEHPDGSLEILFNIRGRNDACIGIHVGKDGKKVLSIFRQNFSGPSINIKNFIKKSRFPRQGGIRAITIPGRTSAICCSS
ncbi:MAG: hypothetical protein KA419_04475 [Acidobacteria bacterium]|nr:hypothetical protein [Acidobacteriota bacterium]